MIGSDFPSKKPEEKSTPTVDKIISVREKISEEEVIKKNVFQKSLQSAEKKKIGDETHLAKVPKENEGAETQMTNNHKENSAKKNKKAKKKKALSLKCNHKIAKVSGNYCFEWHEASNTMLIEKAVELSSKVEVLLKGMPQEIPRAKIPSGKH